MPDSGNPRAAAFGDNEPRWTPRADAKPKPVPAVPFPVLWFEDIAPVLLTFKLVLIRRVTSMRCQIPHDLLCAPRVACSPTFGVFVRALSRTNRSISIYDKKGDGKTYPPKERSH